jgi:hypothetical protein
MMNEYIRAILLLDETKPLAVIEPLHDTICHANFLLRKKLNNLLQTSGATLTNGSIP